MTALSSSDSRNKPTGRGFWRLTGLVCTVVLLWLVTRPYFGLLFDARFYMVEALNVLNRANFADDLYFKFGSQGNFSVFTQLYLPLLRSFGVSATGMILTIVGQSLWLFGLFRLTRVLVDHKIMWLSMAVVIGTQHIYAGGFSYGEGYLTARLYAEALVMLGLAFLGSKPHLTFILLALAAPIHPLMAIPGIAVALVYLSLGRPVWWLLIGAGAGLAAALGLAGIAPFSNLFRTIDPEWFAVVAVRSGYSLLSNWSADSFVQVFANLVLCVGALLTTGRQRRRFLAATLLVGVGGLVCAYLGGDVAHNLLLMQIQSWRSMWLLQLVSRIYAPLVLAILLARRNRDGFRWATFVSIGFIMASSVIWLAGSPNSAEVTPVSLTLETAALALMALHLLLEEQKHRQVAVVSVLTGFALICVALWRWDARSPWIRYVELSEPPPSELAAILPPKVSVYWDTGLEMLWFRMRHASYFSCAQGSGSLFYRETAMTFKHRAGSFWPLRTGDLGGEGTCSGFNTKPRPERNRMGLQRVCIREPELGYVILTTPLEGLTPKIWNSPVRFQDIGNSAGSPFARATDRFYIYSCASLR